ncbi:MAG: sensor histidine kinase [Actinomycetota bacterium]|nr:sensor histidine kinase [Actinomycetota bacterium]
MRWVDAILSASNNQGGLRECRVLKENSIEAMDLLIKTTPLKIKGQIFGIVAITDISHEKRRRVLERIFFHDLMNTAASIKLFAHVIDSGAETITSNKNWQNLVAGLNQLTAELRSQKELLAAENNELAVRMEPVDGHLLLKEVVEAFKEQNPDCRIVFNEPGQRIILNTDQRLLRRVLENMVLNALEASKSRETVTVSCKIKKGFAEFSVHNHGYIPKEHQLQLFQRSFTTKGTGRGLGTYSMKLLSERYLQGSISLKARYSKAPHL